MRLIPHRLSQRISMRPVFIKLAKYISGISFLFVSLVSTPVYAYDCTNWVAKLQSAQGSVQVRQANKQWLQVQRNATFCKGDVLRVQENSRAALLLRNDTLLRLNQNTTITFTNLTPDKPSVVSVTTGFAHFISRVKAAFEVITPFINAAIEGTEFVVAVNKGNAEVTVFEGTVRAYNKHGEVRLTSNQTAQAKKGQAPVLILKAKPRDAVNWSLHYPIIIEPETTSLNSKASKALSVGQIEIAKEHLQQAIKKSPNDSSALAMQAVISIVQNNKEQGLKLAQQAVTADNKNSTAMLALSYAQQAQFKIGEALETLQSATAYDTKGNALVWSRLAEVYLMHGELDEALTAARKANELNPNIGRTHTVLGFAYLTRIEITEAISAFNNAIEKDQTDPLARLGLGLATIRQGNLENGRREIEYAATLDPNNALIRSYLGKAYFEEKRNKLAATQFKMAKELDPNDPTAYFYNAIRKQSENLTGEALLDIQKSIELNQNRSVYRSQLLLDQDSATRNTNLAKIYRNLGFERLALTEGWKSLKTNPSNYSAHRFLAETYASQSRHEIARVSELFQATMLQQVNRSPTSALLGDSSIDVQQGTGLNQTTFNNYNNLFSQNGDTFNSAVIGGNHKTRGFELNAGILSNNISSNVGMFSYDDQGFRKNNDLQKTIFNLLFQNQISPKTKIILDMQSKQRDRGDRELRFFKTDFSTVKKDSLKLDNITLGATYKASPNQTFIMTISNTSHETNISDIVGGFFQLTDKEDTDVTTQEVSYLFNTQYINTVAGYLSVDGVLTRRLTIQFISDDYTNDVIENDTAYIYSSLKWPNHFTWTLGLSHTDLTESETASFYRAQYNPKLGISWDITNSLTFRAAKFRTIKRRLLTDKSLEPTQVAGFNQFYDDINATDARVEGAALDFKLSTKVFSGLEWLKRDLVVPYYDSTPKEILETDWHEQILRAYIYWNINSQWSSSIDYLYERFNRNTIFPREFEIANTQRLPIKLTFNSDKKVSSSLTATKLKQEGIFKNITAATTSNGKEDLWLYDFNISYKPNRNTNISFIVKNLFDKDFQYQETDINNPSIIPDRTYNVQAIYTF